MVAKEKKIVMTRAVVSVGLAGSGKTWVSYSIWDWLRSRKQDVSIINLDPGATNLPFSPDFDIRKHINLWNVMERYKLGPNGALIASMDLMVDHIEAINKFIRSSGSPLVVIDTPGQMEIFLYRAAGKILFESLDVDELLLLYIIDGVFAKDVRNFVSSMLLGGTLKARFSFPLISVLNKSDLLSKNDVKRIVKYFRNPLILKKDLEEKYPQFESDFIYKLYLLMKKYDVFTDFIPISAVYLTNFDNLISAITRILFGGEEFFT